MFTPTPDDPKPTATFNRTFIWNEPTSVTHGTNGSFRAFNGTTIDPNRPGTPFPSPHLTPRDVIPRILPGQIFPGGREPTMGRRMSRELLQLAPRRKFVFDEIDEQIKEGDEADVMAPGIMDENKNAISLKTPVHMAQPIVRTKTFISDDETVQVDGTGFLKRPPSVESIRLDDPRSPLLNNREAQELYLGRDASARRHQIKDNFKVVKDMLFCQCNCSNIRTKNKVGCLSDEYEEM